MKVDFPCPVCPTTRISGASVAAITARSPFSAKLGKGGGKKQTKEKEEKSIDWTANHFQHRSTIGFIQKNDWAKFRATSQKPQENSVSSEHFVGRDLFFFCLVSCSFPSFISFFPVAKSCVQRCSGDLILKPKNPTLSFSAAPAMENQLSSTVLPTFFCKEAFLTTSRWLSKRSSSEVTLDGRTPKPEEESQW